MNYYNSIAKSYNELHGEEQSNKLMIIKDNIKISKSTKILDVGCGTGISSDIDCFVIGIDPSIELLKLNNMGIKVLGTAEKIPFKDNSFDIVMSVTALHNFKNIEKTMVELTIVFSIWQKIGDK